MREARRILRSGVTAGLLGAAAVALWFLIFDAVRGQLFETPSLLVGGLIYGATGPALPAASWLLVAQYTVLHVIAFIAFGIVAAALIVAAEREPGLVIALIIFFAGFEVFLIALVMFHGPTLLAAVSWWSILAGNLLATAVMLTYFFLRHEALGRRLLGAWVGVVREGTVGGVIGAATVALWFVVYDTAEGRPFYTPALLGCVLLKGIREPKAVHVSASVILGYTVLHGAAFIAFGVLAAVLLALTEYEPILLLGVFVLFTCFEVFFFSAVMLMNEPLVEALGWWTILVANILASTAMLAYFLARHRGLVDRLQEHWASDR